MKIMVLPDVHGRRFWEDAEENIDVYDKVVFLGDYLDPYDFDCIDDVSAITNFSKIIDFANRYPLKVVMLLGNHDLPYFSEEYRGLSTYHCRWSREWHDVISGIFDEYRHLFKIAHVEGDVLFTHAGCTTAWIKSVFPEISDANSLRDLESKLNGLLCNEDGMAALYKVSPYRGGDDDTGSCVWAHVSEVTCDCEGLHFADCESVKQVFGHTLQVEYDEIGNLVDGDSVETPVAKMLDTRNAYVLDTTTFTAKPHL